MKTWFFLGERARHGRSSTRLASNLGGELKKINRAVFRCLLTGGRGVRQNARGRACSPDFIAEDPCA
jgi:hypothetical protein